ncbi:MAG: type I methionyl aminopeptidase [Deltaproteobacteria bacterium]|jgi:methionyl aminopeptidase|nr:type I methionyl aminopeptidase [Deltaproteobacteria bacterium]
MIYIKNAQQIEKIRRSGRLASRTLDMISEHLRPGVTTGELDKLVNKYIVGHDAVPATLGYKGRGGNVPFPASCCISINEEIVHGIPGPRALADGDLVKIDVTTILDGFYGDTARTFLVGDVPEAGVRLCEATRKSLELAVAVVRPGTRLGDIGAAIQRHVEAQGFSVVRDFVGHGVGLQFHEEPSVNHYGSPGKGVKVKSGMIFTIEPMINEGSYKIKLLADNWTAVTADGKLSAQFEHTILGAADGAEILTLS